MICGATKTSGFVMGPKEYSAYKPPPALKMSEGKVRERSLGPGALGRKMEEKHGGWEWDG